MRPLLVLCCLSVALTTAAEPVSCIVLNGRAYAPCNAVPDVPTVPADRRTMHGQEYIAIRAVAEAVGGRIVWGGGPDAHCSLRLPDRDIACRFYEARAYWRHLDPGGIDWWHVGTAPMPATRARVARTTQATVPPARSLRQPQRTPTRPGLRPGVVRFGGPGGGGGGGGCRQGGAHRSGKVDANGRTHCANCGQFM